MPRPILAAFVAAACLASAPQASAQRGASQIQTEQFSATDKAHTTKIACQFSQLDASNQAGRFRQRLQDINPDYWMSKHVKNADCQCRDNGWERFLGNDLHRGYTCRTTITVDFYGK